MRRSSKAPLTPRNPLFKEPELDLTSALKEFASAVLDRAPEARIDAAIADINAVFYPAPAPAPAVEAPAPPAA